MGFFRIGIPTDIDVKRLREMYPDNTLTPGKAISYESVCKVIGTESSKSNRFHSVTSAWRKNIEKESGIILKAHNGQFLVCDEADKAQLSVDKGKTAIRATRRSIVLGKLVDRNALTEDQRKRFDCTQRYNSSVLALQSVKPKAELPEI